MRSFDLSPDVFKALEAEATRVFPNEACGLILADAAGATRAEPMDNEQDRLHRLDPQRHIRDARTAYSMNPLKVQRLVDAAQDTGGGLAAIFHSHPQHPAYFSATDKAAAMPFGQPAFPDAWQLVVSVYDGEVRDLKGFYWCAEQADWQEGALDGLPPLPGPPAGARILSDV